MNVTVHPGVPMGRVAPPGSKSLAHRALFCALNAGPSVISNCTMSEDIRATAELCRAFGAELREENGLLTVTPGGRAGEGPINCRQSGSTLRFAIPYALTLGRPVIFRGEGRLLARPLGCYEELCRTMGFTFRLTEDSLTVEGGLRPGEYRLEQVESSQFVSGMMMALGAMDGGSVIDYGRSPSAPYIKMTAQVMAAFGAQVTVDGGRVSVRGPYTPAHYQVEGDWSQAALWGAMGGLFGHVELVGMNDCSLQGDMAIKSHLAAAGAAVEGDIFRKGGSASCPALSFDCTHTPDLAPILAVVGLFSKNGAAISGAGRLTQKESDRAAGIVDMMAALGCCARREGDVITVLPGRPSGGALVAHDHRMAMMAALMAVGAAGPVTIGGAETVDKSYPDFWRHLASLGIRVDM